MALGAAVALGAGPGERGSALAPFAGDPLGLAAPFAGDLLGLCCGLAAGFFNVETTAILVLLEITACLSSQWLPQKSIKHMQKKQNDTFPHTKKMENKWKNQQGQVQILNF